MVAFTSPSCQARAACTSKSTSPLVMGGISANSGSVAALDLWQRGANIDVTEDAFATFGVALALTPTGSHRCDDACNDVLRVGYKNLRSYFVLAYSKGPLSTKDSYGRFDGDAAIRASAHLTAGGSAKHLQ